MCVPDKPSKAFSAEINMSAVREESSTFADLLRKLGNISAKRIRLCPPPGSATERDVIRIHKHEQRLYELVEGVLVEKAIGVRESYLAGLLLHMLSGFLDEHDLGMVLAPDGMVRLEIGLV